MAFDICCPADVCNCLGHRQDTGVARLAKCICDLRSQISCPAIDRKDMESIKPWQTPNLVSRVNIVSLLCIQTLPCIINWTTIRKRKNQ